MALEIGQKGFIRDPESGQGWHPTKSSREPQEVIITGINPDGSLTVATTTYSLALVQKGNGEHMLPRRMRFDPHTTIEGVPPEFFTPVAPSMPSKLRQIMGK